MNPPHLLLDCEPRMLIGYVSDERYLALADVLLSFDGPAGSFEARSRATGAVQLDLPPGSYLVTLARDGFGAKRVALDIPVKQPYQFRLLSDGLLGYVWPKYVQAGERGEFRVHSVEAYHLSLWRYGQTKELVRDVGWFDEHGPRAVMQITPDGDYTQTGVQWNRSGYVSPHHKQYVTAPAQSGLYYFLAKTAEGRSFTFPWVVAPSKASAPVAVLASNLTWNAYNSFGGRSNYIHADAFPPTPTINARLELARYTDPAHMTWGAEHYAPLSFERPEPINHIPPEDGLTDPIEGRAACHVAPTDWRLLGWLEREGFTYDLYAESQLDSGLLDLRAFRVLILGAHPEYWTRRMYDRVKHWVFHQGGRLMYLGGNGLNCEVELRPDDSMVVLNGDCRDIWTPGYTAESRFARRHESEANLLGVVFTETGVMTAAPYRVLDAAHWAFAGTGLANGDVFGQECQHRRCPGGASGHETDKVSASSPPQTRRLAKGLNPDEGGAELVHFETASGGAVFSAGSICYPSSLVVDPAISRITGNVLRRFLQEG